METIDVQLAARHCELPNSIREDSIHLAQKLRRYEPRLHRVAFTFDQEASHRRKGKARCSVPGGENLVAHAEAETWSGCLHALGEKLTRKLRRQRAEDREHQAPDPGREAAAWM